MKRTMELIAMFDTDMFAGQRVKLYESPTAGPASW